MRFLRRRVYSLLLNVLTDTVPGWLCFSNYLRFAVSLALGGCCVAWDIEAILTLKPLLQLTTKLSMTSAAADITDEGQDVVFK